MRLKKERKDDYDLKKKIVMMMNKQVEQFITKRGKKGSVRVLMEKVLYDNGISRPTFHGGDFSGVTINASPSLNSI